MGSMSIVRLVSVLLAGCLLYGSPPEDATLTLNTKGGRSQFRIGEQIDVELRLESKVPGLYHLISTGLDRRYVRQREYDSFTAEPKAGVADPLEDSGTLMGHGMNRGLSQHVLGTMPVIVPGIVNDWVSFRRPGRYRVTAESERLFVQNPVTGRVLLRSNPIDIEILPADPEWRKKQLDDAVAVLDTAARRGASGGHDAAVLQAARTLRYLETPEAVAPLVRFYTMPLHDVHEEFRAALAASPYRTEVIARMEEAIAAPDVPITAYFMGTLMQIEYARRHGSREPMPRNDAEAMKRWNEADRAYMERFRTIQEQYKGKLAEVLPRKRGIARGVALEALLTDGSQTPAPQIRKLVIDEFVNLPSAVQASLLMRWSEIGGPELIPALRVLAAKPGEARDQALMRLMELDVSAARPIVIERIRHRDLGDPRGPEPQVLLQLPDERLPELDDHFIAALDHGTFGPALVARYASADALPRVVEWLERNPASFCYTAIAAYVFRVDASRASAMLAESRKAGPCQLNMPQYALWRMWSPGLEQAAVESQSAADPMARRSAQTLLQHGGSPAAKKRLFEAFSALRQRPLGPMEAPLETGFVDALIQGTGWVLTNEELDDVERHCITDNCRQFAQSQRRALNRPVSLSILLQGPWQVLVGGTLTFSREQTLDKLKQFPRGIAFRLPEGGRLQANEIWKRRIEELKGLLSEAGMTVQ